MASYIVQMEGYFRSRASGRSANSMSEVAVLTTSTLHAGGWWRRCITAVLTLHVSCCLLNRRAVCRRPGRYRSSSQPGDVGPRAMDGTKRPSTRPVALPSCNEVVRPPCMHACMHATRVAVLIADGGSPGTTTSLQSSQQLHDMQSLEYNRSVNFFIIKFKLTLRRVQHHIYVYFIV